MRKRALSAIFAVAEDMTLGHEGGIPWFSPGDKQNFRLRTMNQIVVMGRKTWESLPKKPLDDRHNIVLTKAGGDFKPDPRCAWILKPDDLFRSLLVLDPHESMTVYVIGGAQILTLYWNYIDRVFLTRIKGNPDGDTKFDILQRLQVGGWKHDNSHTLDDEAVISVEWYRRTLGGLS